jgi:hypothetical protein
MDRRRIYESLQLGQHRRRALTLCAMAPHNHPLIRLLVLIVLVAAGVRLIFELLTPIFPYLVAALIVFTIVRLSQWHRGRW